MSDIVSIEPATPADVPVLSEIAAECGLHVDFPGELARSYGVLRVARAARGVLGFLLAWRAADELHLTDLGVSAVERRRGVGHALVRDLMREGRASAARIIVLEVRATNTPALALYGSLGFVELGRRVRYYADTGEDAVVMQLELGR
jgi:[ribosomal protein S18]-alanine N-acetyltransferase